MPDADILKNIRNIFIDSLLLPLLVFSFFLSLIFFLLAWFLRYPPIDLFSLSIMAFLFCFLSLAHIVVKNVRVSIELTMAGIHILSLIFFLGLSTYSTLPILWIPFFPIFAFLAGGNRTGTRWSIVYITVLLFVYVAAYTKRIVLPYDDLTLLNSFAIVLFITILGYLLSFTEKSVQRELEQAYNKILMYKQAIENSSDHIIITDSDGAILYANKAAETVTGYSQKEMLGQTPRLWGKQMDTLFYQKLWNTIKVDKKPFASEIRNRRKDGELYTAISRIAPMIDKDGKLLGFVATEEDITERLELARGEAIRNIKGLDRT